MYNIEHFMISRRLSEADHVKVLIELVGKKQRTETNEMQREKD